MCLNPKWETHGRRRRDIDTFHNLIVLSYVFIPKDTIVFFKKTECKGMSPSPRPARGGQNRRQWTIKKTVLGVDF